MNTESFNKEPSDYYPPPNMTLEAFNQSLADQFQSSLIADTITKAISGKNFTGVEFTRNGVRFNLSVTGEINSKGPNPLTVSLKRYSTTFFWNDSEKMGYLEIPANYNQRTIVAILSYVKTILVIHEEIASSLSL